MKLIDKDIYINRGDRLVIELSIEQDEKEYVFEENDKISFSIYNKKGLDQLPVLSKKFTAIAGETTINIDISSEEMKIGEFANKPIVYWYEIELNNEITLVGYDEDGAKRLILLPEGRDDNN